MLILPLIYSPYNMLIMKTYLQSSIPDSLEESAFLDGASNFQILWKIVLPLSKPIIATLSLFYAVGPLELLRGQHVLHPVQRAEDGAVPSVPDGVLRDAESQTTALSEAAAVTSTPEVLQAASIMFVTIPVICIYPFVQKYFVKGVMIGAVKG